MECPGPASVVFDKSLVEYDFGPGHPMSPVRVDLTMRLAEELGVLEHVRMVEAPVADDDLIATVHDRSLIAAVTRLRDRGRARTPSTASAPTTTRSSATCTRPRPTSSARRVEAFRQVTSGESLHSASIAGGLHHAMADRSAGFCIYNDIAVGIQTLLDQGYQRVAYVDVDVHHGDGVEQIFYDDPRVLTISLHETGQMLFPGTGFPHDTGGPGRRGDARSTSPCRPAPPTRAGCAPSTPWCRRCCASGSRRSW